MTDDPLDVADAGLKAALDAKIDAGRLAGDVNEVARKAKLADYGARQAQAEAELARDRKPSPEEIGRERRFTATMETAARFRWSPRRRRAERLEKFDAKVRELEERQGQVLAELQKLRERLVAAGQDYQAALTRWHRRGRGERPTDPRPGIEEHIRDHEADYQALTALVAETLGDKAAWVSRNRSGLVRDLAEATDQAEALYRAAAKELLDRRQALIDLRSDEMLLRLFGDEAAATPPGMPSIPAGNLREVREFVAGFTPLEPEALRRVLEADASFLRRRVTQAQRQALKERGEVPADPFEEAVWVGTAEHQQQVREDEERRREAFRREWGREPTW